MKIDKCVGTVEVTKPNGTYFKVGDLLGLWKDALTNELYVIYEYGNPDEECFHDLNELIEDGVQFNVKTN